jgi:predicted phosphodiesterase
MNDSSLTRRDFLRASSTFAAFSAAGFAGARPLRAAAPLRFGLVTDIHYADIEPAGQKMYREGAAKLADCVRVMNEQKVDFLAELGDFKDQGKPPDEKTTLEYLRTIQKAYRGFKGPLYHVLGNHDMDSLSKHQFLKAVGQESRVSERGAFASPSSYYWFRCKQARFLILDANFRTDGEAYDHGNYAWEDANIPPSELDWIEQTLAAGAEPAIVFIHHRLDGEGAYFVKNAPSVRGVLEQSKRVLAVFQGHQHEGGYSLVNGIHYYTLKAVVEGSGVENTSFAIVEADGSFNLTVTGYHRAESRRLPRAE